MLAPEESDARETIVSFRLAYTLLKRFLFFRMNEAVRELALFSAESSWWSALAKSPNEFCKFKHRNVLSIRYFHIVEFDSYLSE